MLSMKYVENMYRFRQIGEKFLVTTDHGSWIFLDENQLKLLKNGEVENDPKLFQILKKLGVIIDDDNKEDVILKLRDRYGFLFRGTSLHIVIPTLRCNEKCVYCQASSKPVDAKEFDMDIKTAKAAVDFIFQTPSKYLTIEFQGGEPLLNFKVVRYIIEYSKKMNKKFGKNLHLSLVSNLSNMDNEKMKYLIDNKVEICTSLDGPEWIHNKNRPLPSTGAKTSYYYTKKWVKLINDYYKKRKMKGVQVNALLTVTNRSLAYWKQIIDEYLKLGFDNIFIRSVNSIGNAKESWGSISYPPEDFINFWKKSMDYIISLNKDGAIIRERLTWLNLKKILGGIEPYFLDQMSPCGAVIGQLAYNYNGDIYSCDEGRMVGDDIFKLGNVKKDKYKNIVSSNQACCIIASSVSDTQICDSCAFKPFCGICPVCNYAEQGSILCNIPNTKRCKIYKAQFDYIFGKILNDKKATEIFIDWLKNKD